MKKLRLITSVLSLSFILSACQSAPPPTPSCPACSTLKITKFPDSRMNTGAPPLAKERCQRLPDNVQRESLRAYVGDIIDLRQKYADCDNKHNELVNYYDATAETLKEVINHYEGQIR